MKKIVIYGVSRSGKSYLIDQLCKTNPSFFHFKGSETLEKLMGHPIQEFKHLSDLEKNRYRELLIDHAQEEFDHSNMHYIVDGHYCFYKNGTFEPAMTDKDKYFYDAFFYLDTPSNLIYERIQSSTESFRKIDISLEEIEQWKSYEITQLKNICEELDKELILLDEDTESCLEFIQGYGSGNWMFDSKRIAEHIKDEIEAQLPPCSMVLLIDCDRTLSTNDGTYDFLNRINRDRSILKTIFRGNNYSLYAFYRAYKFYSSIEKNAYQAACRETAHKGIYLSNPLLDDLSKKPMHCKIIAITSGIKGIWKQVLEKHQLNYLLVGGTHSQFDGYMISRSVKAYLVKLLREKGFFVMSIGDSVIDYDMLINSHKAFVIAHDKLNVHLIREIEEKQSHQQFLQLSYSPLTYDNINSTHSIFR